MRADLVGLQWLSLEQALLWLRDEAGVQLLEKDLLGQCDAGRCAAYLNVDSLKGECAEGLIDELGERFFTVYGVGKGQIINPRVIIEAAGKREIALEISGEVRQIQRAEAEVYNNVDWTAKFLPANCHLLFKTSDIEELVESFASGAAPTGKVKPSQYLTIAALLDLVLKPGRPVYDQADVIEEILDRFPAIRGLSESNLQKIFADSNTAAVDAKML
jgi:hypothetical protein